MNFLQPFYHVFSRPGKEVNPQNPLKISKTNLPDYEAAVAANQEISGAWGYEKFIARRDFSDIRSILNYNTMRNNAFTTLREI